MSTRGYVEVQYNTLEAYVESARWNYIGSKPEWKCACEQMRRNSPRASGTPVLSLYSKRCLHSWWCDVAPFERMLT